MSEREEFEHWMSFERQLSPRTVESYMAQVDQWIRSGEGAQVWILDGPSISTRRVRRAALLCFHKFRGEELGETVIRGRKRSQVLYADRAQVEAVLAWLRSNCDYSSYLVAALMYRTGMRPNEACTLRTQDVNLTTRMASVIGKGDRQRFIPLRQEMVDSLRRWMAFERPRRRPRGGIDTDHLLIGPRGAILTAIAARKQTWRTDLYNAYKACGLWPPHDKPAHWLRHMFATHAAEDGITLMELTYLMGHDNSATTMIYIHRAGLKQSRAKMEEADDIYFGRERGANHTGQGSDRNLVFPERTGKEQNQRGLFG